MLIGSFVKMYCNAESPATTEFQIRIDTELSIQIVLK